MNPTNNTASRGDSTGLPEKSNTPAMQHNPESINTLLARAGSDIRADLAYLTEAEIFGLCLFLEKMAAGC